MLDACSEPQYAVFAVTLLFWVCLLILANTHSFSVKNSYKTVTHDLDFLAPTNYLRARARLTGILTFAGAERASARAGMASPTR